MKNKYFNTFIRKITDKETKESKICISNFPQDIIFELINYIRNYWNGGYSGYVYIREKINIKNRVMIHEISLSYCIFEKDFAIENSKIREMSLNKSIFDQKVSFSKSIFKYDVLEEENHSKQPFESGSFLETKFKGIVDFSNTSLYGVKFENVDFIGEGKNIYFQNSSLYDIKFKNVNFNFSTHFNNSEIEKLYFEGTTFIGNTNFREISFNGETKFLNCTFTSLQNDTSGEVSFSGSTFKQKVEFLESKFQIKTSFSYFEKKDELRLEATNFERDAIFSNCTFGQSNIEEKSISSIDFSNAKFNQKVKFSFSTFNSEVIFKNTKFKDLLYFHKVDFYQPTQFHFTDFTKKAFFSNTHFFKEIQFLYCEVESSSFIRFESSIFEKCLEISRSNFDYCKLRFWDIQIKGEDKINEYTNYEKDFGETLIEPSVYSKIRESFRFIKSTFYAENNKIEGLRFYEKEMSVYLEEKRAEDEKTEGFFSDVSTKVIKIKDQIKDQIKKASYNLQPFFTKLKNNTIFVLFLIILYIPLSLIAILLSPIYTIPVIIDRITRMGIKYALLFFINVVSLSLYMIEKSYYWFWLLALALILLVLLKFYENRKSTREIVKQNNYISPLLLFIMTIIFLVIIYGQEDFKNDWAYKTIHWFLLQILNDQLGLSIVIMIALMSFAMLFIVVLREHDKITLWFNKNSNEFDTNWIAGVNFSILVGFITYFMVLLFMNNDIELDTSTEGISNFITSLVDVFNLTKWVNLEIIDIRLEGFPYLLLFIGRIFIGYGYYQTIQAFRKFGKS